MLAVYFLLSISYIVLEAVPNCPVGAGISLFLTNDNDGCVGPTIHGGDSNFDVRCCKTPPETTCPKVRSPPTPLTDAAVAGCDHGGCTGTVRKRALRGTQRCSFLVSNRAVTGAPVGGAHQVDFDDDLFYDEAVLNLQIAEEGIEFARAVKAKKRAEELMKPSQRSSARLRRYHRTKPRYYD
eukprot:519428_1